jgi:ribosomal-protein-alanine N-acetyltransferase
MIAPLKDLPVFVRRMVHEDLSDVSDIERRSYDFPWSHGVFRDCLLAGYNCLVLVQEERTIGYGILSIAAGEAHILNLCIDPRHRSRGYGARLLDEMLAVATGARVSKIYLEVRPSNENAVRLYRKKGFHQIASRPSYYQATDGREDAAVYARKLDR